MTAREAITLTIRTLLGLNGARDFGALTYEIGKILLPSALLIIAFYMLGKSFYEVNLITALMGSGLLALSKIILDKFDSEQSALVKLPIDELFKQFKASPCNQLRFIHFETHKRIVVYFDKKYQFTLGECESEDLVSHYMEYIQSKEVYGKHGKMASMKPELSFDERGKDSALIATFTRNMAAC
jgi:hypothetical protein|tara:strand:- start:841 stop:1392 length:552 start_codon:yes stop_codon:yes gene_type:complete